MGRALLDKLREKVELREDHRLQGSVSKVGQGRQDRKGIQAASGSALFTKTFKDGCAFCLGDHLHEDCKTVTDKGKRKSLVRRYARCFICLRKGHRAPDCQDAVRCKNCNGDHHYAICTANEIKGATSLERGGQNNSSIFGTGQGSSVGMLVGTGTKIALQTAQAVVKGSEGKSSKVRVIFDSGSHKSFIAARAVEYNSIPIARKEWLNLSTFGDTTRKGGLRDVVVVNVSSIGGGKTLSLEAYVVPEITRIGNVHVEVVKNDFPHLKDLWFSDVNRTKVSLDVDLLIGADHLWNFQKGAILRGKSDEPVAIETELGWVLSGPLKGECTGGSDINANAVVTVCGNADILEREVHRLWDFDRVGIRETIEVHEAFCDNITFNGTRYSVGLP